MGPNEAMERQLTRTNEILNARIASSESTPEHIDISSSSEFPSLSGAPQPHFQNPGQAVWANANQRATQQTPVQRPQQAQAGVSSIFPGQQQLHNPHEQLQQSLDDAFFTSTQPSGTQDDYRHGGQGGVGQLSGSHQPQPNSIDDFPPLGRNGHGEIGQDRRGNMVQNAAAGSFSSASAFASGTYLLDLSALFT